LARTAPLLTHSSARPIVVANTSGPLGPEFTRFPSRPPPAQFPS
jgi:hypothetical protein